MKTFAIGSVLLLLACSKPAPEPSPSSTATAAPLPSAIGTPLVPAALTAKDLGWDVPKNWVVSPNTSSMRKATYKIAKVGSDPEDAEVSVSQAGGALDSNIDRWAGQLSAAKDSVKRTERNVGPFKVTIVEISGKFAASGMPGAPPGPPKDHWALLGAIVEGVDPPYFFKMTGPEKTVHASRADFDKLIDTLRIK